ncbi:MAG: tetratricopeptide repeat protein [Thermoanaerobaculia bacterium]
MKDAFFLLGVPSVLVLLALLVDRARRAGGGAALSFAGALAVYGVLRGLAIQKILSPFLGSPPPYVMNLPVLSLGGVSLQELVGWGVAVLLSWRLTEAALDRAGVAASPYRIATGAAIGMALVCLAVESAAIASGWWIWTLPIPPGPVMRVPWVALLDWSFVAFDFLLPYLLFARGAPWPERFVGLLLFPLHFVSHGLVRPLSEAVPLTGFDLVHAGIAAVVLSRAVFGEARSEPGDSRSSERIAAASALVVAVCTAVASARAGRGVLALATSLPLALASIPAWLPPRGGKLGSRSDEPAAALRETGFVPRLVFASAMVLALTELLASRISLARATRRFTASVLVVAQRLGRRDCRGAEEASRQAIAARPDHPAGHTLRAHALVCGGHLDEARTELTAALDREPTSRDALLLAAELDLERNDPTSAAERASLGRRVYPEDARFTSLLERSLIRRDSAR